MQPIAPQLLTVAEVAAMLQMSEPWVRQHASGLRQPSIRSIKLGKKVRFKPADVLAFIDSMERVA